MEFNNGQPNALPAFVTIEGKQVRLSEIPELENYQNALRSQIAAQEKNKLYTTIEELKKQVNDLLKKPADTPIVPADVLTDSLTKFATSLKQELLSEMGKQLSDRLAPVEQHSELYRKQALESYRAKLLTENQNACFPELVVGNSQEELDKALIASKELFGKYKPAINHMAPIDKLPVASTPQANDAPAPVAQANNVQDQSSPQQKVPPTVPPTPAPQPTPAIPADPFASISAMGMEEWEKKRADIKKSLSALYPATTN